MRIHLNARLHDTQWLILLIRLQQARLTRSEDLLARRIRNLIKLRVKLALHGVAVDVLGWQHGLLDSLTVWHRDCGRRGALIPAASLGIQRGTLSIVYCELVLLLDERFEEGRCFLGNILLHGCAVEVERDAGVGALGCEEIAARQALFAVDVGALRSEWDASDEVAGGRALLLVEYRVCHEPVAVPQQFAAAGLLGLEQVSATSFLVHRRLRHALARRHLNARRLSRPNWRFTADDGVWQQAIARIVGQVNEPRALLG